MTNRPVAGSAGIDALFVVNDSAAVTFSHGMDTVLVKGMKKAQRHDNPFVDVWKKGADGPMPAAKR